MKAVLYKEKIIYKKGYGYRSTETRYTLAETGKTYIMGNVYDNVYQLKNKLRKLGYTEFEVINLKSSTQKANRI